jgi:hypothetical protein
VSVEANLRSRSVGHHHHGDSDLVRVRSQCGRSQEQNAASGRKADASISERRNFA